MLPPAVTYMDAAARGPMLRAVQTVAHQAIDALATPWQLSFAAWVEQIEQLRALAAGLFDGDTDAVALVPSAAHGLATAARNLHLQRGEAVLVLEGQFPSNLLIWQRRCAEVGAQIVAVPMAAGGFDRGGAAGDHRDGGAARGEPAARLLAGWPATGPGPHQ